MHMPAGLMPSWVLVVCAFIAVLSLGLALWRVDRRRLRDLEQGLFVGLAYVLLCGLYTLSAGVKPGMQVHFLGVMLTVMMFGPWLALLVLAAVHATLTVGFGIGAFETLGFNIALCVVLPVAVAAGVHTFSYYRLPRTFPVYIIQVGIGDMLCMIAVATALSLQLLLFAHYAGELVFTEFWLLLVMMSGMEAMMSTMIASLLVCFLPQALATFSDEEYLHGK